MPNDCFILGTKFKGKKMSENEIEKARKRSQRKMPKSVFTGPVITRLRKLSTEYQEAGQALIDAGHEDKARSFIYSAQCLTQAAALVELDAQQSK